MSAEFVIDCWKAGVRAVDGETAVGRALALTSSKPGSRPPDFVLAVGKAAGAMLLGAMPSLCENTRCLVVAKDGHVDPRLLELENVVVIESAHPVPDERSLIAGEKAIEFVAMMHDQAHLLLLVSGGASSLIEWLPGEVSLSELQLITDEFLALGYHIGQINAVRKSISLIKGGKLLTNFNGKKVTALAISDIPDDDFSLIGSGIGSAPDPTNSAPDIDFPLPVATRNILEKIVQGSIDQAPTQAIDSFEYESEIVASNQIARDAVAAHARANGVRVVANELALNEDVFVAAEKISATVMSGEDGVYIFGGEPTIQLPDKPGRGGRNQSLALALAKIIAGTDNVIMIIAGTDGTDGPTEAAGGLVTGETFFAADSADAALAGADAGTFLEKVGGLFVCGPTGTNVMDVVVAYKY